MNQYIDINASHLGKFNTASGIMIDLLNPTTDMIQIEDIAQALSNYCRFGGHTRDFYSVAQHSVLVCDLAPEWLKLEALMHDAAEAYLGDVIKPIKILLGDVYAELEARFMKVIAQRFRLDHGKLAEVKQYDIEALELEHRYLQLDEVDTWHKACIDLGLIATIYGPYKSKMLFTQYFYNYSKTK